MEDPKWAAKLEASSKRRKEEESEKEAEKAKGGWFSWGSGDTKPEHKDESFS